MRIIFLTSLLLLIVYGENRLSVGAGPYLQSQPYQGAQAKLLPTPVIFLEYEILYIRWSQIGLYFLGGENWGLSLQLQPRPYGFEASEAQALKGMKSRESSWEGGISLAGKNDYGYAEVVYLHDLLKRSNGALIRAEAGTFLSHGAWTAVPSLLLIYFNDNFNNYYYGVSQSERAENRPFYRASGGLNAAVQSYINYQIDARWRILTNVRCDLLNKSITDSPIVSDQHIVSGMVSLIYNFEL